jgi:amidophosphoribosyltransferase
MAGVRDECGVFAVWGDPAAAETTLTGLFALQHRGQESAGIASAGPDGMRVHTGMGLISQAFAGVDVTALAGDRAVGHVRYSTQGASVPENAQPFAVHLRGGYLAVCLNGNIVNAVELRRELEEDGAIFRTTVDTEVVAHLIARAAHAPSLAAIETALGRLEGAYAFVFLTPEGIVGARDPAGIRPLVLGRSDERYYLASETCALDLVGARYVRDIAPGEIVRIGERGLESRRRTPAAEHLCLFESVYLARPDSRIHGRAVHSIRRLAGVRLAREAPARADVVVGVPDSGLSAAMGYAQESGLPYEMGLVRNRYAARTFIQPTGLLREGGVRLKLSALGSVLGGKRVVLVDDSIVRGTTSRRIVRLVRDSGAAEVHVRIASPPVRHPCHYGIDTGDPGQLAAARLDLEGLRREIGADSLGFVSVEGLLWAAGGGDSAPGAPAVDADGEVGHCHACFTGRYPAAVPSDPAKLAIAHSVGLARGDAR